MDEERKKEIIERKLREIEQLMALADLSKKMKTLVHWKAAILCGDLMNLSEEI